MNNYGLGENPFLYSKALLPQNRVLNAQSVPFCGANLSTPVLQSDNFTSVSSDIVSFESELRNVKSKQGFIGKAWDKFKNITNIGASSEKVEKAISDYKKGLVSKDKVEKAISDFKEGQKECVDIAADLVSGITSFGTFALATTVGIAAAPFTAGASLGLVAAGFAAAGVSGAAVKAAMKKADAISGGREYDSLGYDLATGGINGLFAPLTAGIGGAVGKTIAKKLGLDVVVTGASQVVNSIKNTTLKNILTTSFKYTGGTTLKRATALGAEMAVDGALGGTIDSTLRYSISDNKEKSLGGLLQSAVTGALGGLIMAPVIGGGFKLAGKGASKIAQKANQWQSGTNLALGATSGVVMGAIVNPSKKVDLGISAFTSRSFTEVVDKLNSKMGIVGKEEINTLIRKVAQEHNIDVNKVRNIMAQLAPWSSILSFNNLAETLRGNKLVLISAEDTLSRADMFYYLEFGKGSFGKKGELSVLGKTFEDAVSKVSDGRKPAILLDDTTMSVIERSKILQKKIINGEVEVLTIPAWEQGFSPFHISSSRDIEQNLITAMNSLGESKDISRLTTELLSRLERTLGSSNITNIRVLKTKPVNDIAEKISPFKISVDSVQKLLDSYPEAYRPHILNFLDVALEPASMMRLSAFAKKTHADISNLANGRKIYYYVPVSSSGKKSYGVVANIYKETNGVDSKQFIFNLTNERLPADSVIVLLDDFAGSGNSLVEKYNDIRKSFKGDVVIAPLISTKGKFIYDGTQISGAVERFDKICSRDGKLHYIPAEKVDFFESSDFYKTLPDSDKRRFGEALKMFEPPCTAKYKKKVKGTEQIAERGYENTSSAVIFPYMSPNNNFGCINYELAESLTLNGKGVKLWKEHPKQNSLQDNVN